MTWPGLAWPDLTNAEHAPHRGWAVRDISVGVTENPEFRASLIAVRNSQKKNQPFLDG